MNNEEQIEPGSNDGSQADVNGDSLPSGQARQDMRDRLREARRQIIKKNREIEALRMTLANIRTSPGNPKIKAENIIWIFCTGRSGSTWLASLMGDLGNGAVWDEPLVGGLFGEFYYKKMAHRRGARFIMGERYSDTWLLGIRSMVLDGAGIRHPDLGQDNLLAIKEPHGSVGAPLLAKALPESRVLFLVRDPRDVAASALDGQRASSWTSKYNKNRAVNIPKSFAERNPTAFLRARADVYCEDIESSRDAYMAHIGPKSLVRYEDLRSDTFGTLTRICKELNLEVEETRIRQVTGKYAWSSIPKEEKGSGKFYRKAKPGGWREDLTPKHIRMIEVRTAHLLDEFYKGWRQERVLFQ